MYTRKHVQHPLWLLIWWIIFTSCSSNNGDPTAEVSDIEVSPTQLTLSYQGESAILSVKAGQDWTAYSDNDWIDCHVRMSDGLVEVSASANTDYQSREGLVVVKSGSTRISVPVIQEAKPAIKDPDITAPEGYRLVWNDEFNEGEHPDPQNWYYETGGGGWGNNELQTYVAGTQNGEQLAAVANGILTITAKKIGATVYSIRMNTTESWKYGYFEARCIAPPCEGIWSAFWLMPDEGTGMTSEDVMGTGTDGVEIDIMEYVWGDNVHNQIFATVHTTDTDVNNNRIASGTIISETLNTEFHLYSLIWNEESLEVLFDNKVIFTYNRGKNSSFVKWPFDQPFYLILNIAVGGGWGGMWGIDETIFPARMEIDYVRYYQEK